MNKIFKYLNKDLFIIGIIISIFISYFFNNSLINYYDWKSYLEITKIFIYLYFLLSLIYIYINKYTTKQIIFFLILCFIQFNIVNIIVSETLYNYIRYENEIIILLFICIFNIIIIPYLYNNNSNKLIISNKIICLLLILLSLSMMNYKITNFVNDIKYKKEKLIFQNQIKKQKEFLNNKQQLEQPKPKEEPKPQLTKDQMNRLQLILSFQKEKGLRDNINITQEDIDKYLRVRKAKGNFKNFSYAFYKEFGIDFIDFDNYTNKL